MSQENVDIVRLSIATYNADGLEAAMAFLHPEVEWFVNLEWPEAPIYRGHDGIRELSSVLRDVLGAVRMEPDRFVDAGGDDVVVFGRLRVTGTGSGAATESHRAWVYTLRDGKIIRHLTFADDAEALEAAGLSE
jgi:ketosteroid isomerase-like protein